MVADTVISCGTQSHRKARAGPHLRPGGVQSVLHPLEARLLRRALLGGRVPRGVALRPQPPPLLHCCGRLLGRLRRGLQLTSKAFNVVRWWAWGRTRKRNCGALSRQPPLLPHGHDLSAGCLDCSLCMKSSTFNGLPNLLDAAEHSLFRRGDVQERLQLRCAQPLAIGAPPGIALDTAQLPRSPRTHGWMWLSPHAVNAFDGVELCAGTPISASRCEELLPANLVRLPRVTCFAAAHSVWRRDSAAVASCRPASAASALSMAASRSCMASKSTVQQHFAMQHAPLLALQAQRAGAQRLVSRLHITASVLASHQEVNLQPICLMYCRQQCKYRQELAAQKPNSCSTLQTRLPW